MGVQTLHGMHRVGREYGEQSFGPFVSASSCAEERPASGHGGQTYPVRPDAFGRILPVGDVTSLATSAKDCCVMSPLLFLSEGGPVGVSAPSGPALFLSMSLLPRFRWLGPACGASIHVPPLAG